jgi:hypothetical protein
MAAPTNMRVKRQANREANVCLAGEEWRPVEGYPGYEVSSLGRVRTVRILSLHSDDSGYLRVGLYNRDGCRTLKVSRLVCETFNGPANGLHCAHLNGNRADNCAENLAWTTQEENEAHKRLHGTRWAPGATNGKLSAADVISIRKRRAAGERPQDLAAEYGVDQSTICGVCNGKSWRWLSEEAA